MTKPQLPNLHQTIVNMFLSLNISYGNNITSFELASSHARVTSIKFTKQESVSQWVSEWVTDKHSQWSDSGPIKIDVILEADICEQQGLDRYKCYGRAKIKAFSLSTAEFCHFCFSVRESRPSVLLLWFILPQKFIFHWIQSVVVPVWTKCAQNSDPYPHAKDLDQFSSFLVL